VVWLDNSRIIAIFAVIFLHSAAGVLVENDIGTTSWWMGNIYDSLVSWCVPVFVMISGALLLNPDKKEDLNTFYRKRLSRVFIPFIFWSIFFLIIRCAANCKLPTMKYLATNILSGKPYYHMWFLYMIMILYLFTPFLRKIVAGSSRREITILVVLSFTVSALNAIAGVVFSIESKLFINWFLPYIPYFFLGYLIRTNKKSYPVYALWGVFFVSVVLTAVGCYAIGKKEGLDTGMYFYHNFSVTAIPMSISVMYILKSCVRPVGSVALSRKISALTLGVYLIHPIALKAITNAGYGPLVFSPVVSIPVVAVAVFASALAAAWVIKNIPYLKRII